MQRVWLIRAGADNEHVDTMRRASTIALSYPDVADASSLSADEIEERLIAAHRHRVTELRSRLQSFTREIRPGDMIVTPNPARREVWLSIANGDYAYTEDPVVPGYNHTRRIDWLGWFDHDAAWMRDQHKSLEQPAALAELYNREWWRRVYDSRQPNATPRTTPVRPLKPSSSSRSSSPARAPRAPKPPAAPPKPKAPALILCAGQCGLQWSPYALVDGLCPDCRGD